MIKCIRCSKELTSVDDIGQIVRKQRFFHGCDDFCFCRTCINQVPGLNDGELSDWYQLINEAGSITGLEIINSIMYGSSMVCTSDILDEDMGNHDGKVAFLALENAGAFADEGIMPGCHDGWSDAEYVANDMGRYFKILEELGHIISILREAFGMTQEVMAEKLCIPVRVIKGIESGKEENWNKMSDYDLREFIRKYFQNLIITEYDSKYPPF